MHNYTYNRVHLRSNFEGGPGAQKAKKWVSLSDFDDRQSVGKGSNFLCAQHLSDRVCEVLRTRAGGRSEGWLFPSQRSKCGHLTDVGRQFREARAKAGRYVQAPKFARSG